MEDMGNLGDPVIVDDRQRWTVLEEGSRGSRGRAIVGRSFAAGGGVGDRVRSVAFILIS